MHPELKLQEQICSGIRPRGLVAKKRPTKPFYLSFFPKGPLQAKDSLLQVLYSLVIKTPDFNTGLLSK